jgi:hypothetical protein
MISKARLSESLLGAMAFEDVVFACDDGFLSGGVGSRCGAGAGPCVLPEPLHARHLTRPVPQQAQQGIQEFLMTNRGVVTGRDCFVE